ncbi:hypothetical protein V5799_000044 [Amblyomma americanum]|uniref:Acyltransferase 3 domain-containing protein n=1 Tax=Amblyomma americanum TaxID=6943 RepID=A0AAQ4D466_AMBAM
MARSLAFCQFTVTLLSIALPKLTTCDPVLSLHRLQEAVKSAGIQISAPCRSHIVQYGQEFTNGTPWALKRNEDTFAEELASNAAAQIVSSLVLVVDTFFFLTGLLVVYLTLNRMKESGGKMNWWIFYLHRYWRLTPLIGLFSLFVAVYLPYCGDGPLWFDAISAGRACKLNWWANFLYVQNFIPFEEMCLGYTWYAAVDFQLFLISPPIIYALYRKPRIGFVVIGLLFLLSTTYTAAYIGLRDLPIFPHTAFESSKEVDYMENVYKMPHCRIGPFLIGMICGYVLHTRRGHIIINKRCVYAGWTASTLLTLALLFAVWPTDARYRQLPPYMAALYGSLSRSVWAACIAWILISCLEGYGGPVTAFLSCKALVPLSRLTFAAYIVHLLPMVLFADTRQQSFDFSPGLLAAGEMKADFPRQREGALTVGNRHLAVARMTALLPIHWFCVL